MSSFPGRRLIHFAKFDVTSQVFHITKHSFAIVNLKPLLPGHILVSPLAVKPSLSDLSHDEVSDLFTTVTRIQRTLKRLYKADAFNVAVQDGEAAGQSVSHVHCHVIPRQREDAGGDDKIHQWLEGEEGNVGRHQDQAVRGAKAKKEWAQDEDRKPRGKSEMAAEAKWLSEEMEKDEREEGGKL
ncbi:Dinucleoside triphosphate hydrolase [Recurvomyces mirabilis]|uniref:Bis(5'-adenosyl)-triphosphatase n=1 Tax=Recurvomyces mirabilis TaxID=574656 RepID=A0AAE0WUT1_9PEZI|nr:Dinucleoside triphosphate hydrolase [Recurvomyces mirabilis]KAK5150169.1 Dinucleoside triphosphate hydrolase [Recurvomyces mirabilis]